MSAPPERCDLAVVGAGIIGLAVACELARRHPRRSVCVLEREPEPAGHQTGHNSGVIHAGIYYAPGSLKARLCVEGARELYAFCAARGIRHDRCGKLIVARTPAELGRLDELARRGARNGVTLRPVDAAGLRELEPHVHGVAGLHSPASGVVDFAAVAGALAEELRRAGGVVAGGAGVHRIRETARRIRLDHAGGTLEASAAVFCAGAWADRLAVAGGAEADPRIVPFRGAYLRLRPARRDLVRALIYPVPDPRLPFLGVHLTRNIDGDVLIGPTALVAAARDGRPGGSVGALRDLADTLAWPGTWRMLAAHWRAGLSEIQYAASRAALVRAAAGLVPDLAVGDVEPAFAGVRAQAVGRDGRLIDDFVFASTAHALHVRNAPSPGATAALAIARHVADRADLLLA